MIAIKINLNTPNQDPKVSKEYSLFSLQRQSRNFDSKTGSAIFGTDSNAVKTLVRQRSAISCVIGVRSHQVWFPLVCSSITKLQLLNEGWSGQYALPCTAFPPNFHTFAPK